MPDVRSLPFFITNANCLGAELNVNRRYDIATEELLPAENLSHYALIHTHFQLLLDPQLRRLQELNRKMASLQIINGELNPDCYRVWNRMLETRNIFLADLLGQEDITELMQRDEEVAEHIRQLLPTLENQLAEYGALYDEARRNRGDLCLQSMFAHPLSAIYAALNDKESYTRVLNNFIADAEAISPFITDIEQFISFAERADAIDCQLTDSYHDTVNTLLRQSGSRELTVIQKDWMNLARDPTPYLRLNEEDQLNRDVLNEWNACREALKNQLLAFYNEEMAGYEGEWNTNSFTRGLAEGIMRFANGEASWFQNPNAAYGDGSCEVVINGYVTRVSNNRHKIELHFPTTEGITLDDLATLHNSARSPITRQILFERIFAKTRSYDETVRLTRSSHPLPQIFQTLEQYEQPLSETETIKMIYYARALLGERDELNELKEMPYLQNCERYGHEIYSLMWWKQGEERLEASHNDYLDGRNRALKFGKMLCDYYAFSPIEQLQSDLSGIRDLAAWYLDHRRYQHPRDSELPPEQNPDVDAVRYIRDYIQAPKSLLSPEKQALLLEAFRE